MEIEQEIKMKLILAKLSKYFRYMCWRFVGENDLNAWSAHSKRNAGQGRFAGEIQNTQNSSLILDSDVMDSQMNDYC